MRGHDTRTSDIAFLLNAAAEFLPRSPSRTRPRPTPRWPKRRSRQPRSVPRAQRGSARDRGWRGLGHYDRAATRNQALLPPTTIRPIECVSILKAHRSHRAVSAVDTRRSPFLTAPGGNADRAAQSHLVAPAIAPTLTEAGEYGADQFCWVARRDGQAGAPGCAAQPREGKFSLPVYHPIESPSSLKFEPAR
jgi:hypothetical protein